MRRKDREITDFTRMLDILKACDCCRLGFADNGETYIVPLNFGYEEQGGQLTLYFHCAETGRKLELLPKQKTVAFEMDTKHELVKSDIACRYSYLYQCIMGKGKLEIVDGADAKLHGLRKIMAHYSDAADWEFQQETIDRLKILKLTVAEWSCKAH